MPLVYRNGGLEWINNPRTMADSELREEEKELLEMILVGKIEEREFDKTLAGELSELLSEQVRRIL